MFFISIHISFVLLKSSWSLPWSISFVLLKLKLKPPFTTSDWAKLFLSPSENFRLPEVLLYVPSVLRCSFFNVRLEFLTSSDPTWVIPTNPDLTHIYLQPTWPDLDLDMSLSSLDCLLSFQNISAIPCIWPPPWWHILTMSKASKIQILKNKMWTQW